MSDTIHMMCPIYSTFEGQMVTTQIKVDTQLTSDREEMLRDLALKAVKQYEDNIRQTVYEFLEDRFRDAFDKGGW